MSEENIQEFQTIGFAGYEGITKTLNVIQEEILDDRFIRISVAPNRLHAFIEYERLKSSTCPTEEYLLDYLKDVGIRHGINSDSLTLFINILKHSNNKIGPFEVATGTFPVTGSDGKINFLVNPPTNKKTYKTDDQGNINYQETGLIENAYCDKVVAIIKSPTLGISGKDVFGNSIDAETGKAITVKIGKNISFDRNSGRCKATINGRVLFEDNTISISDTYEIRGDVDLSIGNINFIGKVIIRGSVVGDYTIHGHEMVYIDGRCGPAKISSNGDIFIRGGIAGNGSTTTVKSESGIFMTKYINNCKVETGKGVVVKNEIVNSSIGTGGAVLIEHGSIIGGNTIALKGVIAKIIGSELGVVTSVASGQNWAKEEKFEELKAQLALVKNLLENLISNVEPIAVDINIIKMYTGKKRNTIKSVIEKIKILNDKKSNAENKIKELIEEKYDDAVYQINTMKTLNSGAILKLGVLTLNVKDTINGEISAVKNSTEDFINIGPQISLPSNLAKAKYPF